MSEPSDVASGAGSANGRVTHAGREQGSAGPADPWFEPEPKPDARQQTDWFIRTGRAGLRPDSVNESWEETGHVTPRPETSAAPPWAGDAAAAATAEPPPWESGPWPGPDEARPEWHAQQDGPWAGGPRRPASDDTGNWQALAAVITGVLPLVVPGVVLGVLGLRRARQAGTGWLTSWVGIGLSVIWAVILVVWVAGGGNSVPNPCGGDQNAVSTAVSRVLHDLSSRAPRSALTTNLRQAITQANSAAADAQQVSGRDAMSTLTGGLQQVLIEVTAGRSSYSYAQMRQQVAADAVAMTSACKG
jgi:hypothetical protein